MAILLEIFLVGVFALVVALAGRDPWKGRILNLLKAWVTVRAFWLLLTHPVAMEDGTRVVAWRLILDQLANIDPATFWLWVGAATGIKLIGILASMRRWLILLRGQHIDLPFKHIFGSFMIGRFIGTFLPSTAGLDGYTLYDAARFSGRTVEVTAAKALEKVIGIFGIFLTFLVSLPFGISIFGDNARMVALITVPLAAGLIGALLLVLWFPGFIEWILRAIPLPGKAQIEGVVLRISKSAAAYRKQKLLVLQALFLSWIVHFTTAVMYFCTAIAIGAVAADFWQVTFASSIQIFATVVSPFTIAGEGIREAAQYWLLHEQIGAAAAIVSAALGFWAAEAPTLLGGFFWWFRGQEYRPDYCLVDGAQVDWDEAAKNALQLESEEERRQRGAAAIDPDVPSLGARLVSSAGVGFGAGVISGIAIGLIESGVIAQGGFAGEAQVFWYAPFAYAGLLGGLGAVGGAVLGVLPMKLEEIRGWTASLAMIGMLVPFGLVITLFRVRRDVYAEQMPPVPVLLGILGAFGVLALVLFFVAPRVFRGRAGLVFTPPIALALLGLVVGGGALAGRAAGGSGAAASPPPVPAQLRDRPNVILIMVDTLRADHLSCYGATDVATPNLCALLERDGTRWNGFSHASWTKPSTATLLTSLVPSTHKTMSKPSVLGADAELLSEVMKSADYTTGGIVSNINLSASFGFSQGFDEYHYLGPDYIAGAKESSSKLILYQIARKVVLGGKAGLRFGDFYQDSEVVNRVAFDWLERHKDSRFFLFLHYMDPHDPYFRHPYDGYGVARVSLPEPDPAQAEELRDLYVGEIEYLDANVGKLIAHLRALDLWDEAVVVLTADHGEEFHEHGGWWHGLTLYEEQIHVPLMLKWPAGRAQAPRVGAGLGRHIDVAPTLAALAGASVPDAMQGVDLRGAFADRVSKDRMHLSEEDHEGNVLRGLRTQTWKYIEANEGNPRGLPTRELFDVAADPGERQNLADRQLERVERFAADTETAVQFAESGSLAGAETEVSKTECERLAALGYMDPADCESLD